MDDFLLGDDFDLIIKDNDFEIGDATRQNQKLILISEKGTIRPYPYVGVGITSALHDDNIGSLKQELVKQLELDGMKVNDLSISSDGTIHIDAAYA